METNAAGERCIDFSSRMKRCWGHIMQHKLLTCSLTAAVLGIALGLILKTYVPMSEFNQYYIGFPGQILMQMLQAITVPLIVTSVITGVSAVSVQISRRIAVCVAAFFVSTIILSVTVLIMKPGVAYGVKKEDRDDEEDESTTVDALLDLVRNMIPQNLIQACFQHYKTERMEFEIEVDEQNSSLKRNVTEVQLVGHYVEGTNTLGLIIWSFIFGMTLNKLGDKGKVLTEVIAILNDTTKCVLSLILGYFPLGVLFIFASHVVEVDDWETVFKLGKFIGVVVLGLAIHGTIVLPLVYFLCVRRNPFSVIKRISPALLTASLLSSSCATLPLTYRCCEDKLGIDRRITRFMLPIGSNINKNGIALYEVISAVFIAQFNRINLDLNHVTSAVSSTGVAGIPSTGAVTTLIVLTAAGLPAKEASILLCVEWLLDHCNTVINVMGNCIGVALVFEVEKNNLEGMEEQAQEMPSDAEGHTTDEIQVHISSQEPDEETPHTLPEHISPEDSDAKNHSNEDCSLKSLHALPEEYLTFANSDNENM